MCGGIVSRVSRVGSHGESVNLARRTIFIDLRLPVARVISAGLIRKPEKQFNLSVSEEVKFIVSSDIE